MKNLHKIKIGKECIIYGALSGSLKKPLVIIVHGLPGSMDNSLYIRACKWFTEHGYSTYRFNLYGPERNARQLMDCTLATHANDLDAVIRHFRRKGVETIFVIGHSFGGPTIFSSINQDFDGVALWDPTYNFSFTKIHGVKPPIYVKELNGYVMQWGDNIVIGKGMVDEINAFPWRSIAKQFTPPFKIFVAGDGVLHSAKNYLSSSGPRNEMAIIKNAAHEFNDDRSQERLFRATDTWFKKFGKA